MGGVKKSSYEAFTKFLVFIKKVRELDDLMVKLRKVLPKKPKVKADTYVPQTARYLRLRERIREQGSPYTLFYNVLVSTGCRVTEASYLIGNIRMLKAVDLVNSFVYTLTPKEKARTSL